MKKTGIIIGIFLLMLIAFWRSPSATIKAATSAAVPVSKSANTTSSRTQGSPVATKLNAVEGDAEQDVTILLELLRQYLRPMHRRPGPPIGDDIDLARVLTGHNPLKLIVIPSDHPALSADGHLRDRWGTPYFIHPRSSDAFEIRCAGPDRKLFTPDDVVANPAR